MSEESGRRKESKGWESIVEGRSVTREREQEKVRKVRERERGGGVSEGGRKAEITHRQG